MRIERSFVFAFQDPKALRKLLTGGFFLFLFFSIYFFFVVTGYLMRILYAALEGRDASLPRWENRKELFNEGLLPVLVVLAYVAPLIALFILKQTLCAAFGASDELNFVFAILNISAGLVISFALPLGLIRLVVRGSLNEAFNFSQIFDFARTNPKNCFAAWGLSLAVGALSVVLGVLLVFVGVFFTLFFYMVVTLHLYAQAYRSSTPFKDDKDGKIRASVSIPPPLYRETE
jgi:hypothetical protein